MLQSSAFASSKNQWLLIGGRTEGFHGLTSPSTVFSTDNANQFLWVLDSKTQQTWKLPIDKKLPYAAQLSASSSEYFQEGDILYIVGGYGGFTQESKQANYTFPQMLVFRVSALIEAIKQGGNINNALLYSIESPFLQVSGGELTKIQDSFYLVFGHNYTSTYEAGRNGIYTEAIRKFSIKDNKLADTLSYTDNAAPSRYHRRDFTLAPIMADNTIGLCVLGGVFTNTDDGWTHPVYLTAKKNEEKVWLDAKFSQTTNQYTCASFTIYDKKNKENCMVLMGGIGQNQYNAQTKKWENGDKGAKLPFVKSISQIYFAKGNTSEFVQIPNEYAEMPDFLGANALFIPDEKMLYNQKFIDAGKLKQQDTFVGYLYGGIKATAATSSTFSPTMVNNKLYEVFVKKIK
ncbi:MAG: hypothetical protein EAZ08_06345 [Cytophagales bacterium]|nr:MAG: hypothetical protein EAZ08_06345 [Cytophagales bacterium]